MQRYVVRFPEHVGKSDHAGRIEAYLRKQGIQTEGVSIRWDELDRATLIVNAAADPTDALDAYVPTLTDEEAERDRRLSDARVVIAAIAAKPRADRTPVERALLGLAVAVRSIEVDA